MATQQQLEDFAESSATWLGFSDIPRLNTSELVRGWKAVADSYKAANCVYLNEYVSPKNASPSSTITDPQADGSGTEPGGALQNVYTGMWRHVSTIWSRQTQMYIQTLRLGWAGSLSDDERMVRTGMDSRSDARSYEFYWRNIASSAVDACLVQLRGTTSLVDPLVQDEVKVGTFAISEIVPQQQDDGSYWIILKTTKVKAITAIGDFDDLTPIRKDVHDIENPFGLEGGYTTHVGRKPTDGIVLTYRALSLASRAVIMALTDAQLQTLVGVTDALKYEFIKRDLSEDSGNTLTLSLAYQYIPLATEITAESARFVKLERKNQSNKLIIELSWPRIDPEYIDTISATVLFTRDTVTNPVIEGKTYAGEYFVNTTTAPMTDNEGIRIVQRMTKSGDQKLDVVTGKDPDHRIYEFYRWDISALDVAHFMAQEDDEAVGLTDLDGNQLAYHWGTPELGITKNVRVSKKEDESFDLYAIYADTANLTKTHLCPTGLGDLSGTPLLTRDTYVKQTERAHGWNIPVSLLKAYADYYNPTSGIVNQRNTFNIRRQTEHVFDFDGTRETFIPLVASWVVSEENEFQRVSVRQGSFILLEHLADGGITPFGKPSSYKENQAYRKVFKANDVGSYDGYTEFTEFFEYDSGEVIIEDTHERTVSRREGRYLLPETVEDYFSVPETQVDGTTVTIDKKNNAVGTVDAVKQTIVIHSQESVAYDRSASQLVTRTEKTAEGAPATSPDDAAGHIKSVVNKERPDGKVMVVETDREIFDQESAGGSATLLETVAVEAHTSGEDAAVPDAQQNVGVVVVEMPTAEGKKSTRVTTTTKEEWDSGDTPVVIANDGIRVVKQKLLVNQKTAPAAENVGESVSLQGNGFGGFDAVLRATGLADGLVGSVKYVSKRSELDWSYDTIQCKRYTWRSSTDGSVTPTVTGFYPITVRKSRYRTKTITVTKEYLTEEPAFISVTPAASAGGDGAGNSYMVDIHDLGDGLWYKISTDVNTDGWSSWETADTVVHEWQQYIAKDSE